jgi:hypothetical protein
MSRIILFLLLCGSTFGQVASIIDPTNRCDWLPGQTLGVRGGIPNRTTVYTNFTSSATAANLNGAVASCPSNQVILLAGGNYALNATISNKSGVTIRGAATAPLTVLDFAGATLGPVATGMMARGGESMSVTGLLYSGYTKGSSNLVLANGGPTLTVGKMVNVFQGDNTNFMHTFDVDSNTNHQSMVFRVEAISNTTNVSIWPPMPWGFTAEFNPRYRSVDGPWIEYAGFENLTIKPGAADYPVYMEMTYSCWASNVVVTNIAGQCGFYVWHHLMCEIQRCDVRHSTSVGDGYGIDADILDTDWVGGVGLWVNDCIFDGLYYGVLISGVYGSAISYNFSTNEHAQSGVAVQTAAYNATHAPGGLMVLWEGNFGNSLTADKIHGSVSYHTLWRNRFHGLDSNTNFSGGFVYTNAHQAMVWMTEYSRKWNAVGNVLGASWSSSNPAKYFYEISAAQWDSAATDDNGGIWMLGFNSSGQPLDTLVKSTMIRYQNYDFFHQYSTNETAVGGSPTVDSSLLFGSTPSFFGTNRFPAVAPELTPVYVNIPAHDRYLGVVSSGSSSGSVTANQISLGGVSVGGNVRF